MTAQVLWLWLDHEKFGCGRRQFVAEIGKKWVHLTLVATGERSKISKADYDSAVRFSHGSEINTQRARRRLRRNAKVFGIDTKSLHQTLAVMRDAT